MTTIAAYVDHKGRVGIAADSAVTTGPGFQFATKHGKLYQLGPFVVGFAGIVPPAMPRGKFTDTPTGLAKLCLALRKAYGNAGHGILDEEGVAVQPFSAVVVSEKTGVHFLGSYGEPITPLLPYMATGSGADYAIGVMHLCHDLEADLESALTAALSAACQHDASSSGPIIIHMFGDDINDDDEVEDVDL